jgi:hypothetical protein
MTRMAMALLVLLATARPLAAQSHDPIAAEALFEAGRQFFEAGDFAAARSKFAETVRLDPTAGAFSNLAACEEKLGLTASAWQSWRAALEYVPPGEKVRRASISAKIKALEPVLSRLVLRLPEPPEGTEVRRDGVLLGTASLGIALPVDPGNHEVLVTAPGYDSRRFTFTILASDRKTIDLAVGRALPAPAAPAPEVMAPQPQELRERAPAPKAGPSALGITLLVASAAAFGAGAYTGLMARDARQETRDSCQMHGTDLLCMASAKSALDRDKRMSLYTDIGLGAGLVMAGAGLLLLLGGSDGNAAATNTASAVLLPQPGGGTLQLGGIF